MAIITTKGYIYGRVGPVIYRRYRGSNIVQSQPRKYRQTAATIRSSAEFGIASSAGRAIRQAFEPLYLHHDGAAVGRLTSAVYRCIRAGEGEHGKRDLHGGDLSFLEGLEFNDNSHLADVLPVRPQVRRGAEGEVIVHVPAFHAGRELKVPAPFRPGRIRLRLMLLAFHFHDQYFEYVDVQEREASVHDILEAGQVVLKGDIPEGAILMAGMSVVLLRQDRIRQEYLEINSREYSPAAILGAWQPERPSEMGYEAFWEEYRRKELAGGEKRNVWQMIYCGGRLISMVDHRVKNHARAGSLRKPAEETRQASLPSPAAETEQLKGKRVGIRKE